MIVSTHHQLTASGLTIRSLHNLRTDHPYGEQRGMEASRWILMKLINQIGGHTAYFVETGSYLPGSNLAVPMVFYCIILQNSTSTSLSSGLGLWVSQYSNAPSFT